MLPESNEDEQLSSVTESGDYEEPPLYYAEVVRKDKPHFSINLDSEESSQPTLKEPSQHTPRESTHEKPIVED